MPYTKAKKNVFRGELHWEWVRKLGLSISVDIKFNFYTFSGTRYAAFLCPFIPSFPLFCAGTFATLLRTISNLGGQVAGMLINHLRKMLEDKTNKCNGASDFWGKNLITNNISQITSRFCGLPPSFVKWSLLLKGQSGFCNPMADGYNRAAILTFVLIVWYSLYFSMEF